VTEADLTISKLRVQRTQWAVGNGFFHSGEVSTKRTAVNYVYDCGALAPTANQEALLREVVEFANRVQTVDFMFVSHFDFDHVSGIKELASRVHIKRFVIPLLDPMQRILLFARNISQDPSSTGPGDDVFYRDLVIDPVGTLGSLGEDGQAPEVILIAPQASPDAARSEPTALIPPKELKTSDRASSIVVARDGTRGFRAKVGRGVVWQWFPFVAEQARVKGSVFAKKLKALGAISAKKDLNDPRVVKDLVLNKRDDLVAAYDAATASAGTSFTRNLSSLMLYSGPSLGRRYRAYRTAPNPVERAEHGAWNPRPGWLGFGDADLRAKKRVDEVNRVFRPYKGLIGTFAPSHHGSALDWNLDLLQDFDQSGRHVPSFVFGASGAFGHPDHGALLDINEFGGTTLVVGLAESSRWTEAMNVFIEH